MSRDDKVITRLWVSGECWDEDHLPCMHEVEIEYDDGEEKILRIENKHAIRKLIQEASPCKMEGASVSHFADTYICNFSSAPKRIPIEDFTNDPTKYTRVDVSDECPAGQESYRCSHTVTFTFADGSTTTEERSGSGILRMYDSHPPGIIFGAAAAHFEPLRHSTYATRSFW